MINGCVAAAQVAEYARGLSAAAAAAAAAAAGLPDPCASRAHLLVQPCAGKHVLSCADC